MSLLPAWDYRIACDLGRVIRQPPPIRLSSSVHCRQLCLQWDSFTIVNHYLLHNSTLKYGISYRPLDQRDNVGIFGGQNRRKSRKSENGKKRIRTPLDPVTRPDRRRNRTRGCGLRSPSAIINSGARPLESQSN